jgi:hypothetical protein
MGMTAAAALLAVSGFASAATAIYGASGYIVSSNCAALSPTLAVGQPSNSTLYFTPSTSMALVTGGTPPTANTTGSAVTNTCVSLTATPATFTKTVSADFECHTDTLTTNAPAAILIASFTINTTNSTNATDVESVSQLWTGIPGVTPGATELCAFTSDATWITE